MTAFVYDMIYIVPVFILALSNAGSYIGIPEYKPVYYIAAVFLLTDCLSVRHFRGRFKIILPGISIVLVIGMIIVRESEERAVFIKDNIWFLWTLLIVIASFLVGLLVADNRRCRLIAAAGLLAVLIYLPFKHIMPDKLQTASSFMLLCFVAADEIQRRWKKSGYTDLKGHIVSVTPFIILLGLIVYLIPAPDKPYDWNIAKQIIRRISDGIKYTNRLLNSDKEDYAGAMGFREDGTYFGDLFVEDDELMELDTPVSAGRVMYLSGRTLDDFNGREWNSLYHEQNKDHILDTLQTIAAVDMYERAYNFDYYKRIDLKVSYDEFNTGFYFVPSKLLKLTPGNEKEEALFNSDRIISQKHLGYGTHYDLSYLRLNDQNPDFKALIDNAAKPDEEEWDHICYAYNYKDEQGLSYQDYLAYVERVYEYYLPPTEISEKAAQYLESLSEGAGDKIEVLNRLDRVLSGFSYTLSPGELPEKIKTPADFTDYLLFEKQEGYCTHYATAFVIMARSMGIPARFVQGFLVPLTGRQPYIVRSSMAHAWAEVYIDNVGWIRYEPTPGIEYDNSWKFMPRSVDTDSKPGGAGIDGADEKEQELPLPAIEDPDEIGRVDIKRMIAIAALVMAFVLVFIIADKLIRRSRYKKMGVRQRCVYDCQNCIGLLKLLGLKLQKGETLSEYRERAIKLLFDGGEEGYEEEDAVECDCLDFLEAYEYILYSRNAAAEEYTDTIGRNRAQLYLLIKQRRGVLYAFFARLNMLY